MTAGATPGNVRLNDGLGPNAEDVESKELTAALDKSGSVVLINRKGDIVFYAADGKIQVQRLGRECDACIAANLRLAEAVARAWNAADEIERLRAALERIGAMDPATDSIEGYNEWGESDCFRQAQSTALMALGPNV